MVGSVTLSPALMAALKQSAPTVSMESTGTSFHPTFFMPSSIPIISPPPPTEHTTRPGRSPSLKSVLHSSINDAWPALHRQ